ncbi:MAG: zinc ribbon domain-containing protein [Actinobacteria bacterium]|nr:MAG: zinc ribbon domain-containing protein [Actinomycetota bacterium]
MLVALFGITNEGLNLFVNLVVLFLVVVWIALVAWTFLDARRRIQDPVLVACATGASLFPYVGTVVYSILRPPEFLEDARERRLEIRATELRVMQLEEQSCPNCDYESCQKPIDPRWTVCPYCETPQRRAAPQPRRGEPVRRAPEGEPTEKRGARPKRARPEARRQPASQSRSGEPRQTRPAASRQASAASKRKPASGRSASSAPPTREGPGEDRPRPATAS